MAKLRKQDLPKSHLHQFTDMGKLMKPIKLTTGSQ